VKTNAVLPQSARSTERSGYPAWLSVPAVFWLGCFFIAPLLIVLVVSFANRGTYGGVVWQFTLANYAELFHPLYLLIFTQSLLFAFFTTLLCLIIGFPLAYFIARAPRERQSIWLLLVLVPFWTNFLVRTYAWMVILRAEGFLNGWLLHWGLIDQPVELLYRPIAVLIGLVYGYLPFMVLPLYVACERIDPMVLDAGRDLYAGNPALFRRVIWPLAKPGVIAGSILVFIPTVGAFLTPDLLGGARTMMIGNLIQHEYLVVRDWPLGSALAFVLMAVVLLLLKVYLYADRRLHADRRITLQQVSQ
jgi:spermidine/putrescine transport system permease protein